MLEEWKCVVVMGKEQGARHRQQGKREDGGWKIEEEGFYLQCLLKLITPFFKAVFFVETVGFFSVEGRY